MELTLYLSWAICLSVFVLAAVPFVAQSGRQTQVHSTGKKALGCHPLSSPFSSEVPGSIVQVGIMASIRHPSMPSPPGTFIALVAFLMHAVTREGHLLTFSPRTFTEPVYSCMLSSRSS